MIGPAAAAIARGEIVAYPTETFYGLAVDAFDCEALARLRDLKGRGVEKAFSVLVADRRMLDRLCVNISSAAEALMARHWPGPLTLALPARPGLPESLVLDGCVAVRISPNPLAQALVVAAGPITATSANPAGAPAPTTAAGVAAYFPSGCYILDGGTTPGGAASTLARVRDDRIEVLRPGPVTL
jgi:L-threonylcarbamoyladenylate synthase